MLICFCYRVSLQLFYFTLHTTEVSSHSRLNTVIVEILGQMCLTILVELLWIFKKFIAFWIVIFLILLFFFLITTPSTRLF